MKNAGRKRLGRADAGLIADALRAQGYEVRQTTGQVEARDPTSSRYICGFYWRPAAKDPLGDAIPACWRFDVPISDCFSLKDLKSCIREASRVQRIIGRAMDAWKAFVASRSDRRWMEYRGIVAALFLRQDIHDEDKD